MVYDTRGDELYLKQHYTSRIESSEMNDEIYLCDAETFQSAEHSDILGDPEKVGSEKGYIGMGDHAINPEVSGIQSGSYTRQKERSDMQGTLGMGDHAISDDISVCYAPDAVDIGQALAGTI